jgi:gluconokinase
MDYPLVLALDIGTSSTRTALFDTGARRLEGTTYQIAYPLRTTADGGAELEPGDLLEAVNQCLEGTLRARRNQSQLRGRPLIGVGMSCFWHSLLGCDRRGRPLTRVITWADSRCRTDAAGLREQFSEAELHGETGCMVRASFWPAKLTWLRRTQPPLFAKVERWMSPGEWLQLQLAGSAHCALAMATGTGVFQPGTLEWHGGLLKALGVVPDQLLPLTDEPVEADKKGVGKFPELRGVPWFPGIGDGAASNLGSGATQAGFAAINVGTSAALRVMREGTDAKAPFGLFCYRVDSRRYLVGGALSNAGNLRAWCLKHLQVGDPEALEDELARRPGPAHGLSVLPFWTAERAPFWEEDDRGAVHGITQHTDGIDLLQAITEATYHRLALIAEMVLESERVAPKFIVSGGIQRSQTALQRLADVLGHPLYPNDDPEASIRGAAIFVLEKLGVAVEEVPLPKPVRCRKRWVAAYADARRQQRELEDRLRGK